MSSQPENSSNSSPPPVPNAASSGNLPGNPMPSSTTSVSDSKPPLETKEQKPVVEASTSAKEENKLAAQKSETDIKDKGDAKVKAPPKAIGIEEHLLPLEQIEKKFSIQIDAKKPAQSTGLSKDAVAKALEIYGPNIMTPPKTVHPIIKFLICLSNLFNVLLIISGIFCYILLAIDPIGNEANVYIGAILIGVAFINALIEFVQQMKSENDLKSFLDLVPRKCLCVRDEGLASISATELVPGDIVNIRMGDKLPADVLVFWASEFKVDNSSLTGESDPQERGPNNTHENPLEATNLAFNGTLAVNGEAYGVVIKTGDSTVLGQIATLASSEKKRDSPLTQEIENFVHIIAAVAGVVAIVFFAISLNRDHNISIALNFAIGIFVSFVPEGLPATVTMLLTIAAKRMKERNVLVKDLKGVETLGAITCLATDKTGTLTRNQMTVTYIWSNMTLYDASSHQEEKKIEEVPVDYSKGNMYAQMSNLAPQEEKFQPFSMDLSHLNDIAHICYLCSKAKYDRTDVPLKQRMIIGDATESGLFTFAGQQIPDSDKLGDLYPKVFEIPFNSTNKWHLSIHKKKNNNGPLTLFIKGAPERVFRLCSSILLENGKVEPMTSGHQQAFQKAYEKMASKGHRVIGCASLFLSGEQYPENFVFKKDQKELDEAQAAGNKLCGLYPQNGYTFTGLVSLEDPPKHGVREAIGQCRQAGIKVMMVTGDHPLTAEAIGRKINLMLQETKEMVAKRTNRPVNTIQEHEFNAVVIHGEMIDKLTEEEWENILDKEEIIFARTSPKHKLQIVKRCQARGHIVGVTGDGVNDSPALKKADLGIAMNISGSDVSKEAASMILLDDNFASTVAGITEGRLIFQNLKKSIRYTVSHTMPQVIANLLYIIVPLPLPLSPLLIIMVDLGFELFIALAYAWELPEKKEQGLMTMLPRKPVNPRSIDLLRRENSYKDAKKKEILKFVYGEQGASQLEDQPLEKVEEEKMSLITKTKFFFAHTKYFFTHLFDKEGWGLFFEKRDEEILVDVNLLSYSYLEVGILITIGCFLAYFHVYYVLLGWWPADVQKHAYDFVIINSSNENTLPVIAYQEAEAAYYFGIFIQQCFNHFLCKVTLRYPIGKMLLLNKYSWIGILIGGALACFIVYPPFMWQVFSSYLLDPQFWLFPICMGFFILIYGSLRIFYMKRRQPVNVNLNLPLDLHPTRWSTKSIH